MSSEAPSPRNDARPATDVRYTDFVDEAVSATCGRCARTEFDRGTAKKNFGDKLRDGFLWRVVGGQLVCFLCICKALRTAAAGEPIRFTFDGCGYVTERIGNPHPTTFYIEARRTDGSGGRLIPLDGAALDAVLARWRP